MQYDISTSLIVATFRRPAMLQAALTSVAASTGIGRGDVEIIVVDNNSGDETKDVVARTAVTYPFDLTYVLEVKAGVSNARNAGAAAARGRFVAFMDDDQQIDPGYLARVPAAFAETQVECVGGRTGYVDSERFPPWISVLIQRLGARDFGNQLRPIGEGDAKLQGGNIAFVKSAFDAIGGFDPDFKRAEDVEIQERFLRAGGRICYDPQLRQNHYIEPSRLKRRYFLDRAYDQGRTLYRRHRRDFESGPRVLGIPRRLLGQALDDLVQILRAPGPGERFNSIYLLCLRLGQLREAILPGSRTSSGGAVSNSSAGSKGES